AGKLLSAMKPAPVSRRPLTGLWNAWKESNIVSIYGTKHKYASINNTIPATYVRLPLRNRACVFSRYTLIFGLCLNAGLRFTNPAYPLSDYKPNGFQLININP